MSTETAKMNLAELTARVLELQTKVAALETTVQAKKNNSSDREMTDADARSILNGEHAQLKHKDAAEKLSLSYGQIYSCRLGFTFKHIHNELAAVAGYKNSWMKA